MTSLDALQARGWKIGRTTLYTGSSVVLAEGPATAHITAMDAATAERMAVAAALVAEGHDLIGLLREVRVWVPRSYGGLGVAALNDRVDAVLAAEDGEA